MTLSKVSWNKHVSGAVWHFDHQRSSLWAQLKSFSMQVRLLFFFLSESLCKTSGVPNLHVTLQSRCKTLSRDASHDSTNMFSSLLLFFSDREATFSRLLSLICLWWKWKRMGLEFIQWSPFELVYYLFFYFFTISHAIKLVLLFWMNGSSGHSCFASHVC